MNTVAMGYIPPLPADLTRVEVFAKLHKASWRSTIDIWRYAKKFNSWDLHLFMNKVPWDRREVGKARKVVEDFQDVL